MAQRSTRRTDPFSAARLSDILPGSYLLAEQSPGSSQCAAHSYPNARLIIVKENLPVVKEVFSVFNKFFQKISELPTKIPEGAEKFSRCSRRCAGKRHFPPPALRISMRRPSRCRCCTSLRRQGRSPRCRTAGAACSGWRRRPAPSSSARTPAYRTTWCEQSRRGQRPSP